MNRIEHHRSAQTPNRAPVEPHSFDVIVSIDVPAYLTVDIVVASEYNPREFSGVQGGLPLLLRNSPRPRRRINSSHHHIAPSIHPTCHFWHYSNERPWDVGKYNSLRDFPFICDNRLKVCTRPKKKAAGVVNFTWTSVWARHTLQQTSPSPPSTSLFLCEESNRRHNQQTPLGLLGHYLQI